MDPIAKADRASARSENDIEDADAPAPLFGSWRRWYAVQIVVLIGFIAFGMALSLHYR